MKARFFQLVRHVIGGNDAYIIAFHHTGCLRHADGKSLPGKNVLNSFMTASQTYGDSVSAADAAPGCVHGVGSAVFIVGGDNQNRLGIGKWFCSEIFSHALSSLCVLYNPYNPFSLP